MALMHLTETFIPDLDQRKFSSSRKITEAEIKSLTSDRLSEGARRYIEETPSSVLEGKTVWKVPISKYDWKNANGRVYEKKLWERVIREQAESYQGNVGLADHPGDDAEGSFKESAVVWLNMGLDENNKLVWGECIFVGPHGKLAEEIMEAGGRVGFSSSGFGELSESDRSTVRWDTYQLERPADIVLNPSQGVYGRRGMQVKKENSGMREATETKENETMGINESTDSTNRTVTLKLSKAEIRSFREQAEGWLESAKGTINPKDRLDELSDIHSYWGEERMSGIATDLKERVEAEIKLAESEIGHAIQEHVKLKEDFEIDNVKALKEGVEKIVVDTKLFKRDLDSWKSIAEGLQEKVGKLTAVLNTRPTAEIYKNALDQIKKVKEIAQAKENELLANITELQSQIKKRSLVEKKLISELKTLTEEKQAVLEENVALRKHTKALKSQLNEIAVAEQNYQKNLEEAVNRQNEINIHPSKVSGYVNPEVREYYNDLQRKYGRDILPYKESILHQKTVREAARVHLRALAEFGSTQTTRVSDALPLEERKKLIEGQTGRRVVQRTDNLEKRLPATWE